MYVLNILNSQISSDINTFQNLTENGTASHSRTFLQLFPKLFLLADSGVATSLSRVCDNIQAILQRCELTFVVSDSSAKEK